MTSRIIRNIAAAAVIIILCGYKIPVFSHCQIPCGIYDDKHYFKQLFLDIKTIRKSTETIINLSQQEHKNPNQLVRWVINKENHANSVMKIIAEYFLAQRLKKPANKSKQTEQHYLEQLKLLHQMLVAAMKCKQRARLEDSAKLRTLTEAFYDCYFQKH